MYSYIAENIEYAPLNLPRPPVHATHPLVNPNSENKLLEYIMPRLHAGKRRRDMKLGRMRDIDRKIQGWLKLSKEDQTRENLERITGIPQAKLMNLPLIFVHLQDMQTYLVQSFSPNRGMFYELGDAAQNQATQSLVKLMNNHALESGYFKEVARLSLAALKYDECGAEMFWDVKSALEYRRQDGQLIGEEKVRWQGNTIRALDMYNTFLDPTVDPSEVYRRGEYAGKAFRLSPHEIGVRARAGIYHNVNNVGTFDYDVSGYYEEFYVEPSTLVFGPQNNNGIDDGGVNWVSWFSASTLNSDALTYEIVEMYCRINPMVFKLLPNTPENRRNRNRIELWRFSVLGGTKLIETTHVYEIHDHIPYYFGKIHDDQLNYGTKSVGELLEPLQQNASFALNINIEGMRKNIYGSTYYDPQMFDFSSIPEGAVNVRVPMKAAAAGKDIRTGLYHDDNQVDTSQTMKNVNDLMSIADNFFPTSAMPNQVASIDRAVDSQVAATVQGSNRRNQKMARTLDELLFRPMRIDMFMNIVQYHTESKITDYDGSPITVSTEQLASTDSQYVVGMGLQTLDRQAAASASQGMIFALIQAPAVAQQYDIGAMIDNWGTLIDLNLNMKQFKLQAPVAAPAATDAAGNPVDPATDPRAITAPLTNTVGSN